MILRHAYVVICCLLPNALVSGQSSSEAGPSSAFADTSTRSTATSTSSSSALVSSQLSIPSSSLPTTTSSATSTETTSSPAQSTDQCKRSFDAADTYDPDYVYSPDTLTWNYDPLLQSASVRIWGRVMSLFPITAVHDLRERDVDWIDEDYNNKGGGGGGGGGGGRGGGSGGGSKSGSSPGSKGGTAPKVAPPPPYSPPATGPPPPYSGTGSSGTSGTSGSGGTGGTRGGTTPGQPGYVPVVAPIPVSGGGGYAYDKCGRRYRVRSEAPGLHRVPWHMSFVWVLSGFMVLLI